MLNGRAGSRNLDHPDLAEIFAAAKLGVPVYVHPQMPDRRFGMPTTRGSTTRELFFAGPGLGWHYETGIQFLRLISGTFDRHLELQVIVGHSGEVVLFFEERLTVLDRVAGLDRPVAEYLRENVYYTPSGMFSQRYLHWILDLVGIEPVMFSADYPYQHPGAGTARRYLEQADLEPAEKINEFRYQVLAGSVIFGTGAPRARLGPEMEAADARRTLLPCAEAARELAEALVEPFAGRIAGRSFDVGPHVPVEVARGAIGSPLLWADSVLSIGGGSTTGTAKAIALELAIPIVAVPTAYAGSEMTPARGLTEADRKTTGRSMQAPATRLPGPCRGRRRFPDDRILFLRSPGQR